jgi:threonylcarbamoyladenosine tRNA methylthiotransferase MtaB
VGFPGETKKWFEETIDRLRQWPIHYFHVFSYSPRLMARSQKLPVSLSSQETAARSALTRELGQRKKRVFYESFIGKKRKALFEQRKNGYWTGLTDNYIRVKVKSDDNLNNGILDVRMVKFDNQSLIGTLE